MNRLLKEKRIAVIAALLEGNSIRSTVRMTVMAKKHSNQAPGSRRISLRRVSGQGTP
jgi:hypothetical protein